MPYLYTAVRECHETGLPIIRALWLHHPDDRGRGRARRRVPVGPRHPRRAGRREGRDEPARSICRAARWIDFWTEERVAGRPRDRSRRSTSRRCRSTCAPAPCCRMGPVKQYTDEPSDAPLDARRLSRRRRRRRRCTKTTASRFDVSPGRVDAHRDALAGRRAAADAVARAGRADAAARPAPRSTSASAGSKTTRRVVFEGKTVTVTL